MVLAGHIHHADASECSSSTSLRSSPVKSSAMILLRDQTRHTGAGRVATSVTLRD